MINVLLISMKIYKMLSLYSTVYTMLRFDEALVLTNSEEYHLNDYMVWK